MWSLLASFCVWCHWAQIHFINKKQFEMWFAGEHEVQIRL
jgi:hypothetical protein